MTDHADLIREAGEVSGMLAPSENEVRRLAFRLASALEEVVGERDESLADVDALTTWRDSAINLMACQAAVIERVRAYLDEDAGAWAPDLYEIINAAPADALRAVRAEAVQEIARLAAISGSFWERVPERPKDSCWMWSGGRRGEGEVYGGFDGTTAHRYSWALHNGGYPASDVVIRHRCDTPLCVRPDHLKPGSQEENVEDMIERGRAFWQRSNACPSGHPRTVENIYLSPSGKRECRECRRIAGQRRAARERANTSVCLCGKTVTSRNRARHVRVCPTYRDEKEQG